jgi:DNA-binding response OmpR family regulator
MPQISASLTNVLVVEDEHVIGLFIQDTLEQAGFQVELTATANEARQRLRTSPAVFVAAIIDVGLPDQPGDELAQEIRRMQPQLPIIIATGLREDVFAKRFANDAKIRTIGKPYDGPMLLFALATVDVSPGARHHLTNSE